MYFNLAPEGGQACGAGGSACHRRDALTSTTCSAPCFALSVNVEVGVHELTSDYTVNDTDGLISIRVRFPRLVDASSHLPS